MRSLLILLGIVAAAAPAHAGNNEVWLGSFNRALRSSSANALTSDSLIGGQLGYARKLGIDLVPKLSLWAVGGMTWGGAEGLMFQTLTTELDTLGFTAGGRARYTLHKRVIAHARLDLGTQRAAVTLRDQMGHSAADASWGAVTTTALGLDLLAAAHPRFSLGLRLELGYVAATGIELTALSERGEDGTIELPMSTASLGKLDLGGRWFGVSVISQF